MLVRLSHLTVVTLLLSLYLSTPQAAADDTPATSCASGFAQVAETTQEDWEPPQNVFSATWLHTIRNAAVILPASQVIKSWVLGNDVPVVGPAFLLTVVNDVLVTITSHWFATGKLKSLRRLFGDRDIGFWKRAGANIVLGTSIISLSWLGSGVHVGPAQLCGAFGLCAVVYPTLQALKTQLYTRLPLKRDVRTWKSLKEQFPEEASLLEETAFQHAADLGISKDQASYLLLTALEAHITKRAIEQTLPHHIGARYPQVGSLQAKLKTIAAELQSLGTLDRSNQAAGASLRKLVKAQRQARRALFTELLSLHDLAADRSAERQEMAALLNEGEHSTEAAFSIALHRILSERSTGYNRRLWLASVVDMSIAIGFFGGVCLEATNHWAQTGEIPPVLEAILPR